MSSRTRARRLALLTFAFTGATIVSARAFFVVRILRIVGLVAIATVVAVGLVATGFSVFMVLVRFAGEVRAAFAYMQTAVIAASASFVRFMTNAIVGRSAAFGAAPLAANALATAKSAALTTGIKRRSVVDPVVKVAAANPFDEVDNAAAVRVVSFEVVKSCNV